MKNTTIYQSAKAELKNHAKALKTAYANDFPAMNMYLNDLCDEICKRGTLSEYQQNLLHNYTCELHPKRQKRDEKNNI